MNLFTRSRFVGPLIALLVITNLVLVGTILFGRLGHPRPGRPPSPERAQAEITRLLVEELNLTREQEASLRDIQKGFFARMDAVHRDIQEVRGMIVDESFKDRPDEARIKTLAGVLGEKESRKEQILSEHMREIAGLCGPEQRAQFEAIVRDFVKTAPPGPPPPPLAVEHGRLQPSGESSYNLETPDGPRAEQPF